MARPASKKGSTSKVWLFLTLLGLPFFAVGCFMGYLTVSRLGEYVGAKGWVETPARVQAVELESHTSDDSTTYEVICTYAYTFEERDYQATRVGLAGGADNIGDWQQDTYDRLKRSHDRGEPVPCFVNPDDPDQALLSRELRLNLFIFHLIFVVVFGGAGAGMLAGGLYLRWSRRRRHALSQAHPDEPWRWNPKWHARVISSGGKGKTVALWIITILWNAISTVPLALFLSEELRDGNYLALITLLFPLVGLFLLAAAVRATLQDRKFGRSRFELATLPGVVGGHLRGDLVIAGDVLAFDTINVSLQCINRVTTGSGENSSTRDDALWEERQTVRDMATRFGQVELRLPLDFQIPYDCRPTDDSDADNEIEWKLTARSAIPGVDLELAFEVPVFKTAESDASVGRSEVFVAAEVAALDEEQPPLPKKIRLEQDQQGNPRFIVSAWPGMSMGLMLLLLPVVFLGVAVFAFVKLTDGEWFFLLFMLAFGFFGVIFLLVGLSFFGSFRTTIGPEEVHVERSHLFFTRRRSVAREGITRVSQEKTASSTSSGATTVRYYAVYLHARNEPKVKVAGTIRGELAARWFARQMEECLGLSPEQAA